MVPETVSGPEARTLDWLERLSGQPVSPTAGSAAALAGAMGVALLIKLAQRAAGIRLVETSQEILCTLVEADLHLVSYPGQREGIETRLDAVRPCKTEMATA